MNGSRTRRLPVALALVLTLVTASGTLAAGTAAASPAPGHESGTLPDGATWIADVPAQWNGTLLLYSHGYGPLTAADAPDPTTQQALLRMGYALAGSSYDPHGSWWALGSAVRDQFETLATVKQTVLPAATKKVYAFGTSMGGLISALEDQGSAGRLDGALTTCGIVAGANNLNQYQLDGEYALNELLAPSQNIQLTNFVDGPAQGFADSASSAGKLLAAAQAAQGTPQGRARLALVSAFLNVSPWGGPTIPGMYDYVGQEQGQYADYFTSGPFNALTFIVEGRDQIEAAAGGEGSGTVGVDFARLLRRLLLLRGGPRALQRGRAQPAQRPEDARAQREPQAGQGGLPLAGSYLRTHGTAAGSGTRPPHDLRPARARPAGTLLPHACRPGRRQCAAPPGLRPGPGTLQLHLGRPGGRPPRARVPGGKRQLGRRDDRQPAQRGRRGAAHLARRR